MCGRRRGVHGATVHTIQRQPSGHLGRPGLARSAWKGGYWRARGCRTFVERLDGCPRCGRQVWRRSSGVACLRWAVCGRATIIERRSASCLVVLVARTGSAFCSASCPCAVEITALTCQGMPAHFGPRAMAARGERGLGRCTGDPRRRGVREAIDGAAECGQIRWKGGFTPVRRDSQGGGVGATRGGRVGGGIDRDVCAIARDAAECRGYRCKTRC